jgi:hypothetical protein
VVHQTAAGDLVGQAVVVCSTDAGKTFNAPIDLGWESIDMSLPDGVIPNAGVTVAAAPRSDALYVAFTSRRPGSTASQVLMAGSNGGGRTWSEPVGVTPDDSLTYFQPNIAVDAAGRVGISAFALADGHVDVVLLLSKAGELRFRPPLRVTTTSFNPHSKTTAGKHGAWWLGDYQGITSSGRAFHLVWNEPRTGKLDLFAASVTS